MANWMKVVNAVRCSLAFFFNCWLFGGLAGTRPRFVLGLQYMFVSWLGVFFFVGLC